MKKIFTLCVAAMAAMSMSATITNMTCAEAKDAALNLQSGETGTDTVCVTGYVTNTDGKISRGQQTFWLDDAKGTTKTFQSYWGNLPADCVDNNEPLNLGDKVSITGFLLNYNGTTAEMKNGAVVVLERAIVNVDTLDVTVCEAIEEGQALADGDNTQDVFRIASAIVTSVIGTNTTYNTANFYVACDENTTLQAYNVTMADEMPAVGDEVSLIGKLKKYGTTIEIIGNAAIVNKGSFVADTIRCNVAAAVEAGMALAAKATSTEIYVVTGYCDSIAYSFSADYNNMSFYMCDDLNAPSYAFEAYKAKTEVDIPVGTKVSIIGNLYHYVKDATDSIPETHIIEISNGTAVIESESGIQSISLDDAVKFMENGNLYIRKDGVTYTVLGAQK